MLSITVTDKSQTELHYKVSYSDIKIQAFISQV